MSDAKNASGGGDGWSLAIFWVFIVIGVLYLLRYITDTLGISFDSLPSFADIFGAIFGGVQVMSIFLSLVFFLGIIYFNFKLGQLSAHHGHGDGHGDDHQKENHSHQTSQKVIPNSIKKWQEIERKIESSLESDWRFAIIEADIILDEMLSKMGYRGDNVSDKLKMVEKSDFNTIENAWEAHKIRNRVAHSGSDFHLNHNEAKRAIELFKSVFEEFYFI